MYLCFDIDDLQDEYTDLVEEAAVLQTVCAAETLTRMHDRPALPGQVTSAILVRLQIVQDMEMADLLLTLPHKVAGSEGG